MKYYSLKQSQDLLHLNIPNLSKWQTMLKEKEKKNGSWKRSIQSTIKKAWSEEEAEKVTANSFVKTEWSKEISTSGNHLVKE